MPLGQLTVTRDSELAGRVRVEVPSPGRCAGGRGLGDGPLRAAVGTELRRVNLTGHAGAAAASTLSLSLSPAHTQGSHSRTLFHVPEYKMRILRTESVLDACRLPFSRTTIRLSTTRARAARMADSDDVGVAEE